MALVDAYDRKTGKKLPYLVPEDHFEHPKLGQRIAPLPSSAQVGKDASVAEPTVVPGSVEEAHQLKGAALDDALEAADLPKTGTADEKRAALAEYRANPDHKTPPATDGDVDTPNTPGSGEN